MFAMIAGCGRLGAALARVLSSQGNDVVVVGEDIDPRRLGGEFDGTTVPGSPIDEGLLALAGIGQADIFVAATADDRLNAMAAQLAREVFEVPAALARISDPSLESFYRGIGLDTVCPTSTAVNQVLDRIREESFSSLRGWIDPGIVGIRPPAEWLGKALGELEPPGGKAFAGVLAAGIAAVAGEARPIAEGDVVLLRRAPREGASP
ncbi:MAG TPA: NAD-binding protein [Spirochaetales bacterium]|nr:NAD-binding protein [Spirochaetales bacterium]HRY54685.1 NAD-binding protein [Spirochaetia bacterium]HRZ63327.1 NAD-binding protein [Spirochaetia bacterium]